MNARDRTNATTRSRAHAHHRTHARLQDCPLAVIHLAGNKRRCTRASSSEALRAQANTSTSVRIQGRAGMRDT